MSIKFRGVKKLNINGKMILVYIAFFLMNFKLMDYSLLRNKWEFIDYQVIVFLTALVTLFFSGIRLKLRFGMFDLMLLTFFVATFMKGESDLFLNNCLMLVALFIFFNAKEEAYSAFVITGFICVLPYLVRWTMNYQESASFLGNRGPIFFMVAGLMVVTLLYIYQCKQVLIYAFEVVVIIITAVFGSRTSMIAGTASLLLLIYYNFRGKLTVKKFFAFFAVSIAVIIGLYVFKENILSVLLKKWGGILDSDQMVSNFMELSGRSYMWEIIFKDLTWWGLPIGYMQNTFNLANAHNNYIQAFVSFGIPAGIIHIIWTISVVFKQIKNMNNIKIRGIALLSLPMIMFSFFESSFVMDVGYPFLGLCITLMAGQIYQNSQNIIDCRGVKSSVERKRLS